MEASSERHAVRVITRTAAKSAIFASVLPDVKLGSRRQTLGIMTPDATERTSLEKHGGSDSVAVVLRELFYVKDSTFYHRIPFFR